MMYGKIHHVGIGVRDLSKTVRFFRDVLGFKLEKELVWNKLGLKAALFPIGEAKLEFMEPINPEGEIPQSLAEAVRIKDGIIHHLAFSVENIQEAIKHLKANGVKMISEKPVETEGGKIAWLDKGALDGFMIELCEEGYEIR